MVIPLLTRGNSTAHPGRFHCSRGSIVHHVRFYVVLLTLRGLLLGMRLHMGHELFYKILLIFLPFTPKLLQNSIARTERYLEYWRRRRRAGSEIASDQSRDPQKLLPMDFSEPEKLLPILLGMADAGLVWFQEMLPMPHAI